MRARVHNFQFTVYNNKDPSIAFMKYTPILDSYQYSYTLLLPIYPTKSLW